MSHCAIFLPWVFSVVSGNLSGNCICKAGVQAENVSGINYFKANYWSLQEVHSLKLQSWWNYTYFKGLKTSLMSSGMHSSFRWSLCYLPLLPTQFCPKLLVEKKKVRICHKCSPNQIYTTLADTKQVLPPTLLHIYVFLRHIAPDPISMSRLEKNKKVVCNPLCQSQFLQDWIIAGSRTVFTSLETVGAWHSSYFHEGVNWSCSTLLMGHLPAQ